MKKNIPLVKLSNSGVYKENKWLVRGVSLEINKKQIVTLIGPNGSGKTTTAKMILKIFKPDEGEAEGKRERQTQGEPHAGGVHFPVTMPETTPASPPRPLGENDAPAPRRPPPAPRKATPTRARRFNIDNNCNVRRELFPEVNR